VTSRQRSVVAIVGALVYALVGLRILASSVPSVVVDAREFAGQSDGSGGLGAVSIGVSEILISYAALVIASIVASWMLARWARDAERGIRALHRIHRWTIVLPFVLLILVPVAFATRPGPLAQLLLPTSGVVWGVQFVLTAMLLGVYGVRAARTSKTL
jgi:phosphotransferase system  glucose/maltose/N-acetylglucosamine-specific IIC component